MPTETTYTALRENLASYLDQVVDDREILIVRRRGQRDVAIIAADELAGMAETAYLLRFVGIGKPEPLRHQLAGCWSRRITQEHWLVYRVTANRIDFLQARYHYQ
jgi:Txe/YoeB family toxin of toxin-antitoxin system